MPDVTTLGDVAELQVGFAFKSSEFSSVASDRRLLRGDNVGQGRLRWDGAARWAGEVDSRYELRPGDVVLAMDRPWIGAGLKYAIVRPDDCPALLVQRVARLRARPGFDQRFLAYVIASPSFTAHILASQTGTAVPHVSAAQILSFATRVPPLDAQRGIAEVLGALDDKIAANDRVTGTAEALADSIFLRARSVAGESEVRAFGDVAQVLGGGTPSTRVPEYWDGDVRWATPTDVTRLSTPYLSETARTITDAGLGACASSVYPAGSILMTSRATIGAFAIAQIATAVNQGFIVVNAKDSRHQWWLYHDMRSRVPEFISHANGATFLELPRGRFKVLPVAVPADDEIDAFNDEVQPLHDLAAQVTRESALLATTRDELLPLLMSGKVRVRDAEKRVEEVL